MHEIFLQLTSLARTPKLRQLLQSPFTMHERVLQMIGELYDRVHVSLSAGRFPFIYGGDCSVLLAAVPALRDVAGRAGLVFVDGHEDATPMDLSASGETANMEIAFFVNGQQLLDSTNRPIKHVVNYGSFAQLQAGVYVAAGAAASEIVNVDYVAAYQQRAAIQ